MTNAKVSSLKKLLPAGLKIRIRLAIKYFKYRFRRLRIMVPVARHQPLKVILGAAETYQKGWYSTNECWLDISNPRHWESVFHGRKLITHAVAEHVFEHLTHAEALQALKNVAEHMVAGGRIRIAVPDGYHPDKEYLRHVGINGIGDDAADHKQLLNTDVLQALLAEAGFQARHVEGYDKDANLVQLPYSPDDGAIRRSRLNRQPGKTWGFPDADTSLIVDGIKA